MTCPRRLSSELPQVYTAVNRADQILVALDYDGTLAPIVDNPNDAVVPPETTIALGRIAASDRCTLAVISGRSISDLKGRICVDAVLAGNHGLEIEGQGISFVHERAQLLWPIVAEVCQELETRFGPIPGIIVEHKHLTATVHFRQAPVELHGWIKATAETAIMPARHLLYAVPGCQSLEIRPRVAWNKGSAVRLLLGKICAISPVLICAGDDRTDEDMFGILPDEISVRIGSARTRAHYYVRTPVELQRFLDLLNSMVAQGRSPEQRLCAPGHVGGAQDRIWRKGFLRDREVRGAPRNESSSK